MNKSSTISLRCAVGLTAALLCLTGCRGGSAGAHGNSDSTQPQQAARSFFEACGKNDWSKAAEFWPSALPAIDDRIKGALGGLKLVMLDEPRKKQPPFKVGIYDGRWEAGDGDPWVPYEYRTSRGAVRKGDLRLSWTGSNWQFAGGL